MASCHISFDRRRQVQILRLIKDAKNVASLRGSHFSTSWSNAKNKNKSPMFIPILFHEVIITNTFVIVFILYTVSQLNKIGPIHRPKLRSSPKLGQLTERHASAYLHGHRYETVSVDDHFDICPKHLL